MPLLAFERRPLCDVQHDQAARIGKGGLRSIAASTRLKTAAELPMPSVSEKSAAVVNTPMRRRVRTAYRKSWSIDVVGPSIGRANQRSTSTELHGKRHPVCHVFSGPPF